MRRLWLLLACAGILGTIALGSLLPAGARLLPWYAPQPTHVLVYLVFAVLVRAAFRSSRRPVFCTIMVAGGAGLLLECIQAFVPVREFSLQDAALNVLGALIGVAAFEIVARHRPLGGHERSAQQDQPRPPESARISRELSALAEDRLLAAGPLLLRQGHISQPLALLAQKVNASRQLLGNAPAGDAKVLSALDRAGVRAILLKGTLLAHSVYDAPAQRERGDTDLLVSPDDRADAEAALQSLGLTRSWSITAKTSDTQDQWHGRVDSIAVVIDLHWQLLNHPAFTDLFEFEALWARRAIVEVADVSVAGLGQPDALLHAVLHYFAHHGDEFRPAQWLLDMDLLWRAMDEDERAESVDRAERLEIAGLVAEALSLARDRFRTPLPDETLASLRESGSKQWRTDLLRAGSGALSSQMFKLRAARSWGARLAHLRALFFPSAEYMRSKYTGSSRWALPWLYVRRVLEGFRK